MPATYAISPGWRVLFTDLGVDPASVLRGAGLPGDLLVRGTGRLPAEAFHGLWTALERECAAGSPDPLPVRVARGLRAESFDPPLFAALCSRDLASAAERVRAYKPLIGPIRLDIRASGPDWALRMEWEPGVTPPMGLGWAELLFWVALARLATRAHVPARELRAPELPADASAFEAYAGCALRRGPWEVRFSQEDAHRPFLTANEPMWSFFEPELRSRLSALTAEAAVAERVRAALLEQLPAGDVSVEGVSRRLAMSGRTLQRHLEREGTTFQAVLAATREALARHYLRSSALPAAEISFLLGYEDPNSFYRAFRDWTGMTPEGARASGI